MKSMKQLKKQGAEKVERREYMTRRSQVFDFLKRNKGNGFTQQELGKELEINERVARQCALKLVDNGDVKRYEVFEPKSDGRRGMRVYYAYE